jgi:chromosome segregation ATPase
MALPPESDEPTRRLPPTRPEALPVEREVVRTEVDPAWTQAILDRLRSLRTSIALVALLSLAALGVGLWALLTQEEEGDARRGASQQRVQELEARVDAIESEAEDAPSQNAVARLRGEQQQLEKRVQAVEDRADDSGVEDVQADVRQLSDTVDQLGEAIDQLDLRVSDLEQAQSQP